MYVDDICWIVIKKRLEECVFFSNLTFMLIVTRTSLSYLCLFICWAPNYSSINNTLLLNYMLEKHLFYWHIILIYHYVSFLIDHAVSLEDNVYNRLLLWVSNYMQQWSLFSLLMKIEVFLYDINTVEENMLFIFYTTWS